MDRAFTPLETHCGIRLVLHTHFSVGFDAMKHPAKLGTLLRRVCLVSN